MRRGDGGRGSSRDIESVDGELWISGVVVSLEIGDGMRIARSDSGETTIGGGMSIPVIKSAVTGTSDICSDPEFVTPFAVLPEDALGDFWCSSSASDFKRIGGSRDRPSSRG